MSEEEKEVTNVAGDTTTESANAANTAGGVQTPGDSENIAQSTTTAATATATATKKPRAPRKKKEPVVAAATAGKQSEEEKQSNVGAAGGGGADVRNDVDDGGEQSKPGSPAKTVDVIQIDTSKPDGIGETLGEKITEEKGGSANDRPPLINNVVLPPRTKAINKESMGSQLEITPAAASKLRYKWERRFVGPGMRRGAFEE